MSLSKQLALLVLVSRPLSWVVAPTIWFSGLIHSGKYKLVAFGVNDVYDYISDLQNRRKINQWTDGTALHQHHHRCVLLAAKASTALVILVTFTSWRKSSELFSCIIAVLVLLWAYSSPPFRLKERPVLDSLSNGVICWLFWACGYIFDGNVIFVPSVLASKKGWLILLYGSALHSMAAMVDVEADTFAGYRTIATIYGEKVPALFSLTCL
ncbi:hypothetical protein COCSADRAFT_170270 [Bipolaris sorokiniana ND90Pr]|uniref:UbiA prenyltransferase family n=1 Tax=Cochliobolus sativus (strain ND90Pr / ATCC 201652) TaxID=665912 RepID=M2TA66_COCSN|nr:uncharacterized protein COCSADRAFT_170270 [Bipolaris sorokiniana ND90Pr]EMD65812.1 hypothetical protein COCSADRAFT_170270 [Bipolaris sorokiniana ND90Pr]